MVRDSEPPVPEDRERQERNRLFAEEQKQKKDATKRKRDEDIRAREALEKHCWQQEHDRLPREESLSEPELDDDDFDVFLDEEEEARGFGGRVPP
jgi:t-SNARE complex subunit (syntaxin)